MTVKLRGEDKEANHYQYRLKPKTSIEGAMNRK
jgi:hypothetical protein